jgi:excisionase family DNA binding protein
MPQIMTTKEIAKYLKLHEITICKYAAQGRIPAIRIGRVWRFDKDAIDRWIGEGTPTVSKVGSRESGKGMKKQG